MSEVSCEVGVIRPWPASPADLFSSHLRSHTYLSDALASVILHLSPFYGHKLTLCQFSATPLLSMDHDNLQDEV